MYKVKQVIVLRKDLKMRTGKSCSQAAHLSMMFLTRKIALNKSGLDCRLNLSEIEMAWLSSSFAKICVYVESEEELNDIQQKALEIGLQVHECIDSGATEFHGVPTKTGIAIGPDYSEKIDQITGKLKLL